MIFCLFSSTGEVLPIHIQFTDDKASPEREESILAMLQKLVSVVPENWIEEVLPVEFSDDQRKIFVDSLKNLKAVIVGAHLTQSILLYAYCSTLAVLESVWALFTSAKLKDVLQNLCQCLANDDSCTIAVSISDEDFVPCKEELSLSSMCIFLLLRYLVCFFAWIDNLTVEDLVEVLFWNWYQLGRFAHCHWCVVALLLAGWQVNDRWMN